MHGLFSKLTHEHDGGKVKKAIYKPVPAKFRYAIFPGTMLYYFFTYFLKARPFGEQWDIAMHFSIYFNAFHHIFFISFEAAVKIMKLNSGRPACSGIIQFRGKVFCKLIIEAFLFP